MEPTTSFTDPQRGPLYASPSGVVGFISAGGGWVMMLPPVGVTIRSAYVIPGDAAPSDIATQRTGENTYKLSINGSAPAEHSFAPAFANGGPFFDPFGQSMQSDTTPPGEGPQMLYYSPGPKAGMNLTWIAGAAALLFMLR